jgi:hypothetical protein
MKRLPKIGRFSLALSLASALNKAGKGPIEVKYWQWNQHVKSRIHGLETTVCSKYGVCNQWLHLTITSSMSIWRSYGFNRVVPKNRHLPLGWHRQTGTVI